MTAIARRPRTKAEKLASAARAAADVRAYDTNPDVVAYRIERMRTRVDRLIWTGLILGLLFTMANVQAFASEGATNNDVAWWIAWLLDPMVSLVLVGVLLGEQVIARYQIHAGPWVRRTKWVALACTYAMNTWSAWAALDPAKILLHSVPPAIVFCAAEAVTTLRHQITEAVRKAYGAAQEARTEAERTDAPAPVREDAAPRTGLAPEPAQPALQPAVRTAEDRTDASGVRAVRQDAEQPVRTLARTQASGTEVRTAVTRPAAPVDREAVVAELTSEILGAAERGDRWAPDYAALMERTGYSRSWCEKAVRDARTAVFRTDDDALAEDSRTGTAETAVQPAHARTDGPHADVPASRTEEPEADRTETRTPAPVRLAEARTDTAEETARTDAPAAADDDEAEEVAA
ncbi:hypothetical protein AB0O28_39055 [Microbispora sp. NPDC088329]|uniref:hypothetical protein n=1 Tax=Microbispora sp. NPDC088329 TaxID=3154869 RepID=UPI00344A1B75